MATTLHPAPESKAAAANTAPAHHFTPFLPIVLFGLSLAIFLTSEILNQRNDLDASTKAIAARTEAVEKAGKTDAQLERLLKDLVVLGRTNPTAAAIAKAFRITEAPAKAATAPEGAQGSQGTEEASPNTSAE